MAARLWWGGGWRGDFGDETQPLGAPPALTNDQDGAVRDWHRCWGMSLPFSLLWACAGSGLLKAHPEHPFLRNGEFRSIQSPHSCAACNPAATGAGRPHFPGKTPWMRASFQGRAETSALAPQAPGRRAREELLEGGRVTSSPSMLPACQPSYTSFSSSSSSYTSSSSSSSPPPLLLRLLLRGPFAGCQVKMHLLGCTLQKLIIPLQAIKRKPFLLNQLYLNMEMVFNYSESISFYH